jgi:hypothetical protein
MKKIWQFVDGNKTIIGLILLNVIQLTFMKEWLGDNIVPVKAVISALTGLSAVHHIKKGKLTSRSN